MILFQNQTKIVRQKENIAFEGEAEAAAALDWRVLFFLIVTK